MTPIDIQVSRSKVSVEGQAYSLYVGEGGISVLQTAIFHVLHAYSTNKALSSDTKVSDFDLCAKIAFSDFVITGGIVFHKHMYL